MACGRCIWQLSWNCRVGTVVSTLELTASTRRCLSYTLLSQPGLCRFATGCIAVALTEHLVVALYCPHIACPQAVGGYVIIAVGLFTFTYNQKTREITKKFVPVGYAYCRAECIVVLAVARDSIIRYADIWSNATNVQCRWAKLLWGIDVKIGCFATDASFALHGKGRGHCLVSEACRAVLVAGCGRWIYKDAGHLACHWWSVRTFGRRLFGQHSAHHWCVHE